ncbi:MAG: hypothetical protein ACK5WC_02880 [Aphanizomenon sp.]|jgi:predicted transcriptional regulator|uniref:ASCH domain-containing protein n=1 Tax=Aphanizomenon flos-aquae LD13 TaxID=1710894 RepID=A0A1B7VZH3_APHFL|nr:hypothetical protein [Aphanizomenon flos-aquae UKL13-PB]OBQ26419.1 MAG: hypothetical protein AN481_05635 [Aphanizomenon flos-aquae LD13]OBQ28862.1 MAG: hypothetical protein AN483_13355 [Aphanizomenon flos-aquae MDT14a]HCQ22865.1 hypothetical protein [Anabaena sp. UBA12330]
METLLISLKRQHCNNIFNGKKTIELRKRCPRFYSTTMGKIFPQFTKIMIYETTIHKIIGTVEAGEIITRFKDEWSEDEISSLCIIKDEIASYQGDRKGVGIKISNPKKFNTPIPIRVMISNFGIRPPQQFKYLDNETTKRLISYGENGLQ